MIHKATNEISGEFERLGLQCQVRELEDLSCVEAHYVSEAVPDMTVRFISGDDENDVSMRVHNFVCGAPENAAALTALCNAQNGKYRFVKFVCDSEGSVHLAYDLPLSAVSPAKICIEVFARLCNIADETFPLFVETVGG